MVLWDMVRFLLFTTTIELIFLPFRLSILSLDGKQPKFDLLEDYLANIVGDEYPASVGSHCSNVVRE